MACPTFRTSASTAWATTGFTDSALAPEEASDQHYLHLGRALSDLVDLHVTPVARDRVILHEPVAAVYLHGLVRSSLRGLRGEELAHRGEHAHLVGCTGAAMCVGDRRAIHHRPRELRFHRHVGELELDRLVFGNGDAKGAALLRVSERRVQTSLREADRQRGDCDAPAHQCVEELPVATATLAEQVLLWNGTVFKAQRVCVG